MLKKITPLNGFDETNLDNARQNNYAWSMEELDDYIYVGTGRNVPLALISSVLDTNYLAKDLFPDNREDMKAEIWRYKKDGTRKWERVLQIDYITGFRFMYKFDSFGLQPALYACSYGGNDVKIYKSTNGVNWFDVSGDNLEGTSCRSMTSNNGKIYLSTVKDTFDESEVYSCYIYSSTDPEVDDWTLETSPSKELDFTNNIQGAVYFMEFFNDHLYVATVQDDGISVWRTEGSEPQKDGWKLVFDKSGGDLANVFPASMGVFNNYLYLGTAGNPIDLTILAAGKGADLFRIDTKDNWELVVGGDPVEPTEPTTGTRGSAISGYGSGFNIPYNYYMWQIKAYKGQLLITTFDLSCMLVVLLKSLVKYSNSLDEPSENIDQIIDALKQQVDILASIKYPMGFDMYTSYNGTHFSPFTLNGLGTLSGLGNPNNYGGRMLFESSEGVLYIGTANPFQGCEVWEYSRPAYSRFF